MLVFTSVTKSYIPKARVLARSLKRHNPQWKFHLVLSDDLPPGFNLLDEPFDGVLSIDQLGIPNWRSWAFGHSVVELCTAVKGPAALHFADQAGTEKIMYLDPDIKVFNSLAPLETMLDQHEILLTPHLLDAEGTDQAVRDNEISALKHGVYNLGFFAARTSGQGRSFIEWWADRLSKFCIDDIPGGLFTDQRWCDLAPCLFDRLTIVRDRGYNVATWNVAHRQLSRREGEFYAGGALLRFYHFTGYDSGDGLGMLARYAKEQTIAHSIWNSYGADLKAAGHLQPEYRGWLYGQFENGVAIPIEARRLYRAREDLQRRFPDPYQVEGASYFAWWNAHQRHSGSAGGPIIRYTLAALRRLARVSVRALRRHLPISVR